MSSCGETNVVSVAPPAPIESRKTSWFCIVACVVNALNCQIFETGDGLGDGELIGLKIDRWNVTENSVPVPLLLAMYWNFWGVVPTRKNCGGMCGFEFLHELDRVGEGPAECAAGFGGRTK